MRVRGSVNVNHRSLDQSLPGVRRVARTDWMSTTLKRVLLAAAMVMPSASHAATLRTPQIAVGGTALQSYFNLQFENIAVGRDQANVELLRPAGIGNFAFTLLIELGPTTPGTLMGFYNGHDGSPTLMPLFPVNATSGWFAVASFRTTPSRVTVNVLDQNATLVSSTIHLGADRNAIGFYVSGPGGTFFSQDHRNPDGAAQCLFFRGTGINSGSMWFAFEEQPLLSGDRDFDDAVCFIEASSPDFTPTLHTTWGQLKQRFH